MTTTIPAQTALHRALVSEFGGRLLQGEHASFKLIAIDDGDLTPRMKMVLDACGMVPQADLEFPCAELDDEEMQFWYYAQTPDGENLVGMHQDRSTLVIEWV